MPIAAPSLPNKFKDDEQNEGVADGNEKEKELLLTAKVEAFLERFSQFSKAVRYIEVVVLHAKKTTANVCLRALR